MKKVGLFLVLALISTFIWPQTANTPSLIDQLKQASTIQDPQKRLAQFDAILKAAGIAGKQPAAQASPVGVSAGKWHVEVKSDAMTDAKVITFVLPSDSGANYLGSPVVLVIRHSEKDDELFIAWGAYLGDSVTVALRVGDDKPETDSWSLSTDSTASFYPGDTKALLESFLTQTKLAVQTTPYSSNPITAIFDISGLAQAAAPYKADLGWSGL